MSDNSPEDAERNRQKDAEATDEHSGYSIEGNTPPAEGLGVGPTNHEMDVESSGEGAKSKIGLVLILVLVGLFVLLVIGRIIGMF